MRPFTQERYVKTYETLKERNALKEQQFWHNVVTPYLEGLGYDLYDLDKTDYDADYTIYTLTIPYTERKIRVSVGLRDIRVGDMNDKSSFTHKVAVLNESVHYLHFNMDTGDIRFNTILKNDIYTIQQFIYAERDDEKARTKYQSIQKRMSYKHISEQVNDSGWKYFTSLIVLGQLNQGTMKHNKFVEESVLELLKNPSDNLLYIVAESLHNKYIINSYPTERVKKLLETIKDDLYSVFANAISNNYGGFGLDTSDDDEFNGFKAEPQEKPAPPERKPVELPKPPVEQPESPVTPEPPKEPERPAFDDFEDNFDSGNNDDDFTFSPVSNDDDDRVVDAIKEGGSLDSLMDDEDFESTDNTKRSVMNLLDD